MRAFVIGCGLFALFVPVAASAQPPPSSSSSSRGSYTGPGSCAAASCHGSVRPVAGSRIRQTEYNTWIVQDKHAKATEVLSNPVSLRMARILGIGRPDSAAKCLACHALNVPESDRAKSFAAEGVSCEACHGPASGWLGAHTTRNWTHEQSLALGMYDTRDVVRRTERCASCHIGSADKAVDHDMIAAGHPDLVFDLEAFSAAMPKHWQEPPTEPWRRVTAWSAGQLTALRVALERVGRRAAAPAWPEYGELECFACHHSLTRTEDSWRQELGYSNRRPGNPPWNHARASVSRLIARDLDPAAAERLDADLARLSQEISRPQADRARIGELTASLQATVDGLARRAASRPADAAATLRLMRALVDDADRVAADGERSAEQAAMSLDVLFTTYSASVRDVDERGARASLDAMFKQLESPSSYDPRRFAAVLKQFGGSLRRPSH